METGDSDEAEEIYIPIIIAYILVACMCWQLWHWTPTVTFHRHPIGRAGFRYLKITKLMTDIYALPPCTYYTPSLYIRRAFRMDRLHVCR